MSSKIKDLLATKAGADTALGILLILAMIVSFMLGRLSKDDKNAIIIEGKTTETTQINPTDYTIEKASVIATENGIGDIVASKRGTKYYYLWCSGAKSLSAENKIYFDSETSAESAGYTLASNCEK